MLCDKQPPTWLDASLYPDEEPPVELVTLADQVDFLARLCAAWDFGILPDVATLVEVRRPEWREAVDACQLLTSVTYHLLREWHGLPTLPYLGDRLAAILNDPHLQFI